MTNRAQVFPRKHYVSHYTHDDNFPTILLDSYTSFDLSRFLETAPERVLYLLHREIWYDVKNDSKVFCNFQSCLCP